MFYQTYVKCYAHVSSNKFFLKQTMSVILYTRHKFEIFYSTWQTLISIYFMLTETICFLILEKSSINVAESINYVKGLCSKDGEKLVVLTYEALACSQCIKKSHKFNVMSRAFNVSRSFKACLDARRSCSR